VGTKSDLPTWVTVAVEPLGKVTWTREIGWKELNNFKLQQMCSLAPESINQ